MSNLEEFNWFVAVILAKLYDNFPQAVMVSVQEFEPNVDRKVAANFIGTIEFLAREGYITHGEGDDEGHFVTQATLTMKGLKALNRVPEFFEEKITWGERFSKMVRVGTAEAAKETIKGLVTQFVSGQ